MKKTHTAGGLCLVLFFLFALSTGIAETLHLYHKLPFSTASQNDVEHILAEILLPTEADSSGMLRVNDFGYPFDLQIDFQGDGSGFRRIVLHRPGNGYGEGEIFQTLAEKDLNQFFDMEKKLIQLYGEPDYRYFYTSTAGKWTRWMFSDEQWDLNRLRMVFDRERYIRATSIWGNVTLEVWANGVDQRTRGYLTKLKLEYNHQTVWQQSTPQVALYPES